MGRSRKADSIWFLVDCPACGSPAKRRCVQYSRQGFLMERPSSHKERMDEAVKHPLWLDTLRDRKAITNDCQIPGQISLV